MTLKNVSKHTGSFSAIFVIISSFVLLLSYNTSYADYAVNPNEKPAEEGLESSYVIKPVSSMTFEDYYYSNSVNKRYCIENFADDLFFEMAV